MTLATLIKQVAEVTVPCEYHKPDVDDSDPTRKLCSCGGTGRVARFTWAQQACRGVSLPSATEWLYVHDERCCSGLGWLPISEDAVHLEKVLEAWRAEDAHKRGFTVQHVMDSKDGSKWIPGECIVTLWRGNPNDTVFAKGETPIAAALAALLAAVKGET